MVKTEDLYAIREAIQDAEIFINSALFMRNVTIKHLKNDALINLVETVCGNESRYNDTLAVLQDASAMLTRELYYRADEEEYSLASLDEDVPF